MSRLVLQASDVTGATVRMAVLIRLEVAEICRNRQNSWEGDCFVSERVMQEPRRR